MHDYFPFLIIGLTSGAVYALASLGLVLTYRTSGVFNIAHGAVGMIATYLFYSLRQELPTALAAAIAILVLAPILGVIIDVLFRRISTAGPTAGFVASLGLLVGLQGIAVVIYGPQPRRLEPIFPTSTYRVGDLNVGIDQTMVLVIAVVACLGVMAFLRLTHLGLQTRAVVDNRALAGLSGTRPVAVTRFSWMLGCVFAATSGILFAPFVGLDSVLLTLLVVQAFGAAVFGRLVSFPKTVLAAFGLGVATSVTTKIVGEMNTNWLRGLPNALPFIALFLLLVFRGNTFREVGALRSPVRRDGNRTSFRFPTRLGLVVMGSAAVLAPVLSSSRLLVLTTSLAFLLVFSSLSLLIGLSRQLSLCHAVFVVFGATTLAHLQQSGVPYVIALPLAALILTPIGALLAIPAIRLSGLYLGLATFGFGILAQNLLFPTSLAFGIDPVRTISRPSFLHGDVAFCFFTLGVVALGVGAVELVRITRLGRILTGLADSPTAIGAVGINPLASRVVAFCLSAFLAALAGGLLGTLVQSVTPTSFDFFQSLVWVTVLVAAGAQTLGGAVLAALLLVAAPAIFTSPTVVEWQPVVFGVMAISFAQSNNGLAGLLRQASRLVPIRPARRAVAVAGPVPDGPEARHQDRLQATAGGLR